MKQIKSERLSMRLLKMRDWRRLAALDADFSASPYAAYDLPWPKDRRGIKRLTRGFVRTRLFYAVLLGRRMIGYICFCEEEDGAYDVSYLIHSAQQRQGYATESVGTMLRYVAQNKPATRFTAMTAAENLPSVKVLEHFGFTERERISLPLRCDENGKPLSVETIVFELSVTKFLEKSTDYEADTTV